MGENDIIHFKVSENTHIKNRRLKIKAVRKTDDCFTIYRYKTKDPKNIEVSTPISLEV